MVTDRLRKSFPAKIKMLMKIQILPICIIIGLVFTSPAFAQDGYNPNVQEAFLPFETGNSSVYRSASGKPGEAYWQNSADYNINTRLNPNKHSVSTEMTISYTNNSPSELGFVWLQLDQDLFARDSWGAKLTPHTGSRFGNVEFEGGFKIHEIEVTQGDKTYEPEQHKVDTNLKLNLDQPIPSEGGEIILHIKYSFEIPEYGSDRMGRLETKNGWIYELAQWYPRMAVYDDLQGWNIRPYLGAGEFYLEYGTFSYKITAPADFIVVASGDLLNPEEVLTTEQQQRLEQSRQSDERVFIISPEEVNTGNSRADKKTLTWHFRIEKARDIAWAASKAFVWDAARINLPGDDQSLAMSVYPVESAGQEAWGRSTEYVKASVEFYSDWLYKYPYTTAVNVAGIVGGMEYPGLAFCSWKATGASLWGVTNHEFGHIWFPMIVGSNEREYAWMDEGFTTFINGYATQHFNSGEYKPRRVSPRGITDWMTGDQAEPILTMPDQIQEGNLGTLAYYKPALGLRMLRESIIGPELFDEAFREYIRRWAYKHPAPDDFFNTMEGVAGRDLDWFWRGWLATTWTLDQAVDSVSYINNNPEAGSLIRISNNDKMVMPVMLKIIQENGKKESIRLPVEVWHRGDSWTIQYESSSPLKQVVIDPDKEFPDVEPTNNIWSSPQEEDTGN